MSCSFAADYEPLVSQHITFDQTAGEGTTECVSVSLLNDEIAEENEVFSVGLESVSQFVTITSPSSALYTIVDDDCKS